MAEHSNKRPDPEHNPFTREEIRRFDAEDSEAGSAIGKMLSLFFLYTVIAMTISAIFTYWWITSPTVQ
jgi:hypothetical protein